MMNKNVVSEYLEIFFSETPDLKALRNLLADKFWFAGPLLSAHSADDYIAQLRAQNLGGLQAQSIMYAEHDNGVAVLYELITPIGKMPTSEWFWLRDSQILGIRLLNDPRPFLAAFSNPN